MELHAFPLAVEAARRHSHSARPHAPVVPDRRPPVLARPRQATADWLRRAADRVEPARPRTGQHCAPAL